MNTQGKTDTVSLSPTSVRGLRIISNSLQTSEVSILIAVLKSLLFRYGLDSNLRITFIHKDFKEDGNEKGERFTLQEKTKPDAGFTFSHLCLLIQKNIETKLGSSAVSEPSTFHLSSHLSSFPVFSFDLSPETIRGTLRYPHQNPTDPLVPPYIKDHWLKLLYQHIENPGGLISNIQFIGAREENQLATFNPPPSPTDRIGTVLDLFEEQVEKSPDSPAISYEGQLSYRDVDVISNQWSHYLIEQGVNQQSLVPICMDKSPEMVLAILSVLKAGAAYVPIDPEHPKKRIDFILGEINPTLLIINKSVSSLFDLSPSLPILVWEEIATFTSKYTAKKPEISFKPEHPAYVIFTSGTTGKPKGVLVEHAQLLASTKARVEHYQEFASILLVPPFSFDASVGAVFGSLATGGNLILANKDSLQNVRDLSKLLNQSDTIYCVPAYYQFLLEENLLKNSNVTKVIVGGEPLSRNVVVSHFYLVPSVALYNEYGPTETTVWATVSKIENPHQPITIGSPLPHVQIHILDSLGNRVPIGISGELHIAGGGLARAYLNQPELTAEKFIPNPFDKDAPSRIYKTGDIGYWLPNGSIVLVGRIDDQVKILGNRVELGEIESIISDHCNVKRNLATIWEDQTGIQHLVVYFIPNAHFNREKALSLLRDRLPGYMIPSIWIEVEQFAFTSHGKIDKAALPSPQEQTAISTDYHGPRNSTENILLSIWKKQFARQAIGIHSDFLELGGNSLQAMRIISSIKKELHEELSVKDFFRFPSVAKLANHLTDFTRRAVLPDIRPVSTHLHQAPLSYGQESLWFLEQLEGSVAYHLPIILEIEGELDRNTLEKSFKTLVNHHKILRTVVHEDDKGTLYQHLLEANDWEMASFEVDLNDLDPFLKKWSETPFDLAKDFPLRASFVQVNEGKYVLAIVVHHFAFDAWSGELFIEDLLKCYQTIREDGRSRLSSPIIQYADYAIWQREVIGSGYLEKEALYWKNKLNGLIPLQLPTDFPHPVQVDNRGETINFSIDLETVGQLRQMAQNQGATLFMVLLAAFKTLLSKYSAQEDIAVGTVTAGRLQPELENLLGYFVNPLVIRSQIDRKASFTELLGRVKNNALEAFDNQHLPFEQVVATVGAERTVGQNPLFQVLFLMEDLSFPLTLELGDATLSVMNAPSHRSKFDLTLSVKETADGLKGTLEYRTRLFHKNTIQRLSVHYQHLLQSIAQYPDVDVGSLKMIGTEEKQQLLTYSKGEELLIPEDETIIDLFERQVAKTPDAPALFFEKRRLTYRQLLEEVNQLAYLLISKGVQKESLVLLCMERSPEMVVAILGILKAGGAYVPIDIKYPNERIKIIQEEAKASLAIGSKESQSKLADLNDLEILLLDQNDDLLKDFPTNELANQAVPAALAYVIYTSGSTGRPKGVMIEHKNAYSFIRWCQEEFCTSPFEIVYATTSISFDLSVFELFFPLSIGKPVRILENALHIGTSLPFDSLVLLNTVPGVVQQLLNDQVDLSPVSVINMAGEPIPHSVLDRLDVVNIEVRNLYGPSEDTTYSSSYAVGPERHPFIGRPISNTAVYILDQDGQMCPIGIPGEICLSGDGVSRGYLNQEELTRGKFVANPFSSAGQYTRMYRTGDIGRWRPGGQIEFLGRMDDQVKIRGHRIELGEIENALHQLAAIKEAAVVVKTDSSGEKRLVAYVVSKAEFDHSFASESLRKKLPDYMIPAAWISLNSLPLTPHGKINKKALPDPDFQREGERQVLPRTELELELARIWENILSLEKVGIYDDFFVVGGHSLLVTSLIAAIRQRFSVELSIRDVFTHPTIAGIAQLLSASDHRPIAASPIKISNRHSRIPLSFNQESIWFIDQLNGSLHYHVPFVFRIEGPLDQIALEKSFKHIVERHETLRTVIRNNDGIPWQKILDHKDWRMSTFESISSNLPNGKSEIIPRLINQPFDLAKDYMLRVSLIKSSPLLHHLVVTQHHISTDGWSGALIIRELHQLYQHFGLKKEIDLPHLPLQYVDYALWQREKLNEQYLSPMRSYWKKKLEGSQASVFPYDFPRPNTPTGRGQAWDFIIDKGLAKQLNLFSQEQGVTLFMTLLAGFKTLLHKYSNQSDICVGTALAGRAIKETENLIGYFVNPLPLRSELQDDDRFISFLQSVKTTCLDAFENQEVPFEKIVAATKAERAIDSNPLFQVMFVLQNIPQSPNLDFGEVKFYDQPVQATTSKFDLTFLLSENSSEIHGTVEFSLDLFDPETIAGMVDNYKQLLQEVVSNPSLPIRDLPFEQKGKRPSVQPIDLIEQEIDDFKPVHQLIEEIAEKHAENTAVNVNEIRHSYRELNQTANQFAHYLIQRGLKPGDITGIVLNRSYETIVSILAVLKAGAAYLPIDTDFPTGRMEYMLNDSSKVHITHQEFQNRFETNSLEVIWERFIGEQSKYPPTNPIVSVASDDPAYIIYTSGSTGQPKGVVLDHGNIFNLLTTVKDQPGITPSDKILAVSSISFDISIFEVILPYIYGAEVYLLDRYQRKDPRVILDILEKEKISLMFATPTHWKMMLATGWKERFPNLHIISGGESLSSNLADQLLPLVKTLWNIYGPTETTVFSTIKKIRETDEPITVGNPIYNTQIYILNENLEPVRQGEVGEIYIAGKGVAKGYLNRPGLTATSFIKNPFYSENNSRMYQTGDLGKHSPNGEIIILGRKDHQVKLRGHRIELGEIEHALTSLGDVHDSAVILKDDPTNSPHLAAYLVLASHHHDKDNIVSLDKIKRWKRSLGLSLPTYMIPEEFMILNEFPLTSSGKIDRNALLDIKQEPLYKNSEAIPPETVSEKIIAGIWVNALALKEVSVTDNFFEIGGNSLAAVQVMAQLEKESGLNLPLSILFKYPTIQKLALMLDSEKTNAHLWNSLVAIKPEGSKPPLYIVHGGGLNVMPFYSISNYMDIDQPVYGLQAKGLNGEDEPLDTVEAIAENYIAEIMQHNPDGPYALAGYSVGGLIAFEMARQLKALNKEIKQLLLFDTYVYPHSQSPNWQASIKQKVTHQLRKRKFDLYLAFNHPKVFFRVKATSWKNKIEKIGILKPRDKPEESPLMKAIKKVESVHKKAAQTYVNTPYEGSIHLLRAKVPSFYYHDPEYLGWKPYVEKIVVWEVEGEHLTMLSPPNDVDFGRVVQKILDSK